MKKKYFIYGITAFTLLGSCNKSHQSENKLIKNDSGVKIETAIVTKNESDGLYNYSGLVTPLVTTKLSFRLPGVVTKIYIDEGDQVKKGQILAEIDKTSAESSYNAALAMQKQAKDAYNRLKSVYDNGSLPDIKWEEVKSKLEQANSSEQLAKNNLNNCFLKAPSDGVIGSRELEIGTSVMPGISVIDLLEVNDLYVKISVPENEINNFKKGIKAQIVIPAINNQVHIGTVEKVGVIADILSKTYEVKIKLNNPSSIIKPGMACDVNVSIKGLYGNVLSIPAGSVMNDSDNSTYVFVVNNQNGIVKKEQIEVGIFINNNIQVLSGLKLGDIVVVNGQHKLSNNTSIRQ